MRNFFLIFYGLLWIENFGFFFSQFWVLARGTRPFFFFFRNSFYSFNFWWKVLNFIKFLPFPIDCILWIEILNFFFSLCSRFLQEEEQLFIFYFWNSFNLLPKIPNFIIFFFFPIDRIGVDFRLQPTLAPRTQVERLNFSYPFDVGSLPNNLE